MVARAVLHTWAYIGGAEYGGLAITGFMVMTRVRLGTSLLSGPFPHREWRQA